MVIPRDHRDHLSDLRNAVELDNLAGSVELPEVTIMGNE